MDDLFSDKQEPKDYLTELVGEGKQYKDQSELAKAAWHRQQHVEVLERENAQLRKDYLEQRDANMAKAKLEELIDQHKKQLQQPLSSIDNQRTAGEIREPELDRTKLASTFEQLYSEKEAAKKAQENLDLVSNKLKERFGDKVTEHLQKQLTELGLTGQQARQLASQSPQAFIRTLGLDQQRNVQDNSPPSSQMNVGTFTPTGDVKSWQYWQNLKKSDPKTYSTNETRIQMLQAAEQLGERFYDGDFYNEKLQHRRGGRSGW